MHLQNCVAGANRVLIGLLYAAGARDPRVPLRAWRGSEPPGPERLSVGGGGDAAGGLPNPCRTYVSALMCTPLVGPALGRFPDCVRPVLAESVGGRGACRQVVVGERGAAMRGGGCRALGQVERCSR